MTSQPRTCDICGKTFIPGAEHMYRLQYRGKHFIFCSYPCYRIAQAQKRIGELRKEIRHDSEK